MSHRRALTLAATSLLALGLTACGDDAAKPETESASTSAGPTTSAAPATTSTAAETTPAATPPASTAPAVAAPDPADYPGMDQQTEEGAKQAYKYFWDVYVYSEQTGNLDELKAITSPDCGWCQSAVARIESEGPAWETATITHGEYSTESADAAQIIVRNTFVLNVTQKNPHVVGEQAAAAGSYLTWTEGKWLVDSVDMTEAG